MYNFHYRPDSLWEIAQFEEQERHYARLKKYKKLKKIKSLKTMDITVRIPVEELPF